MAKKIVINQGTCIGCMSCQNICPKYFNVVNGLSQPILNPVAAEDAQLVESAVAACPVTAISLVDSE